MALDTMSKSRLSDWKSLSAASATADSEDRSPSCDFDCNICLETVQDPVVTLCGHLFCWPCIYKWLEVQQESSSDPEEPNPPQQCPVCKSEVSSSTLVPLYGRGRASKPNKSKDHAKGLGIVVPRRPFGLACSSGSPRTPSPAAHPNLMGPQTYNRTVYSPQLQPMVSYQSSHLGIDPFVGMIGEMIFAGTSFQAYNRNSYNIAGSSSPRVRRHVMQADRSLSRICFFLFCCILLCLLLF